ncbi:MAG: phosphotransferase [Rhodobacteraceae bacterium]|nr:phosphotransferase [Paracoccaceae bacterium]
MSENVDFLGYHSDLFAGSNLESDRTEIEGLIREWEISPGGGRSLASDFAKIMLALLAFDKEQKFKDRPAQIAILLSLWEAVVKFPSDAENSFRDTHLNANRSELELRMRLASRMFFYGRRVLFNYNNTSDASANFDWAIRLFSVAENDLQKLKDFQKSKLLGMRGTTKLFLGRIKNADMDFWLDAYTDLWNSYELGNKGREAVKSLRELALRILEAHSSSEGFERFDFVSNLLKENDHQYHSDMSQFHQHRVTHFISKSEAASAIGACVSGLESCKAALETANSEKDEAFSKCTRAFFKQVMIQQETGFAEDAEILKLKDVILDLEVAYEFRLGGSSLPLTLLRKSYLEKKIGNDEQGLEDLTKCLARLELVHDEQDRDRIAKNAQASIVDIEIGIAAKRDDLSSVIRLSRDLLKFGESAWYSLFSICVHVSSLLKSGSSIGSSERLQAVLLRKELLVAFFHANESGDETLDKSLSMALSYAANLSRDMDQFAISSETMQFYALALSQEDNVNTEFTAFAGNMSLQYGKQLKAAGDGIAAYDHFRDAIARFKEAIKDIEGGVEFDEEALKPVVIHSKLGEAFLRLAKSGDQGLRMYRNSLEQFEIAKHLGNDTPELLGLMGDVHYRIGFWGRDIDALRNAQKMKEEAVLRGGESRENYSVTGRICEALFIREGLLEDLVKAVRSVFGALQIDPSWPWPYFQLAEIVSHHSSFLPQIIEGLRDLRVSDISSAFGSFEMLADQELRILGIECVLDNKEFKKLILGGRSDVFVLDDPHKLISGSIVLKPTRAKDAMRETVRAKEIHNSLRVLGLLDAYGVAAPIGTIQLEKNKCVYAMRREQGATLADVILGESGNGYPVDLRIVHDTIKFLALFHKTVSPQNKSPILLKTVVADLVATLRRASAKNDFDQGVFSTVSSFLPSSIPCVVKKDGHAENWIISPHGKVIMIDLEATRNNPILLDLAQLIEDFPCLSTTAGGWKIRARMVSEYWESLYGELEAPSYLQDLYDLFAIQRAVFGYGLCRRRMSKSESSTSRRALVLRQAHFSGILEHLSTSGLSGNTSAIARVCLNVLSEQKF